MKRGLARTSRLASVALIGAALLARPAGAHPLGNFSVNRWCAIEPAVGVIRVSYSVDFAEIPTFQQSAAIDRDGDGSFSAEEMASFASSTAKKIAEKLDLELAGVRLPLEAVEQDLRFAPGAGGLSTMKLSALYEAPLAASVPEGGESVFLRDGNFEGRAGWREMIAFSAVESLAVVESTLPAGDRSQRLSSYPTDLVSAPPQVSSGSFRLLSGQEAARARADGIASVSRGDAPSGLTVFAGSAPSDGFTRLILPSSEFGLGVLLAALIGAFFWGGAHALSPGHGKTVVAAYLVGQRGTRWHAVWLGLIVTITHTFGVFALGASTLVLSSWFVPESLYPWLGFSSGLTVAAMGAFLLCRRMSIARAGLHDHDHDHRLPEQDHGAAGHGHAFPDTLSFRGLLSLGISGGIVPCPSALVVLLSAIAFRRILFGMALILAFSMGLAGVLVAVGLLMVSARRLFDRFDAKGKLSSRLGVASAATISLLGVGILARSIPPPLASVVGSLAVCPLGVAFGTMGLGLLFGLKHATEADHIAAVSTIVSEQGSLRRALWAGGLWGAGHTLSILLAGLVVLGLHLMIPRGLARALELGVAVMIIALGGGALARVLRGRAGAHVHPHAHGNRRHSHLHFHEPDEAPVAAVRGADPHAVHRVRRPGLKPLAVGMMHGLAGSAALTLLVLAQIRSTSLGLLYLLVFGAGSIGGMGLMSLLIGLPFAATASRPRMNWWIRLASSAFSLAFGLFYAWLQLAPGAA